MRISGKSFRTIWPEADWGDVGVIDQTVLPHEFKTLRLATVQDAEYAIRSMVVRGASLIGVTAAYGMALAMRKDSSDENLHASAKLLNNARPTAVDLKWATDRLVALLSPLAPPERVTAAYAAAHEIAEDNVSACASIGQHGGALLKTLYKGKAPLNVLTHCNAGWLAMVDHGTALSPIYAAHDAGIPVHVWVDETRPRNQGASLTAWELAQHGVPHTLIVDNAGGLLMRRGEVDACIVGSDRVAANGDVCNKVGTYLKALAAFDNNVPFFAAMPHSTIDWTLPSGELIPIEERDPSEVLTMQGRLPNGSIAVVEIAPKGTRAANHAFDVTPARLVTKIITERGACEASRDGLLSLYPERRT